MPGREEEVEAGSPAQRELGQDCRVLVVPGLPVLSGRPGGRGGLVGLRLALGLQYRES